MSGSKFYIITNESNIIPKINEIKKNLSRLKLKENYNFDEEIKISFYKNRTSISTEEVFEYLEILDEIKEEKNISISTKS